MVRPNAKTSGSTSVACWLPELVNGSVLTRVSVTFAPAASGPLAGCANSSPDIASMAAPKRTGGVMAGKGDPFAEKVSLEYQTISRQQRSSEREAAGCSSCDGFRVSSQVRLLLVRWIPGFIREIGCGFGNPSHRLRAATLRPAELSHCGTMADHEDVCAVRPRAAGVGVAR